MNKPKLYLNENISWRISRALRGYGYDVTSSHEVDMDSESDERQFEFAVDQKRAVVTNNFRDFAIIHKQYLDQELIHYGIIFTTKYSISIMIKKLRIFLEAVTDDDLINQIRWLNEFE